MLEDDVLAAMKRTMANTSAGQGNSGGKGKRTQRDRDPKRKRSEDVQVHASGHRSEASPDLRQSDNPTPNNDNE